MAENGIRLRILAPERIFYEGDATMVELTTTEGDMGILPGHIPTTCVIAPGVLTIYEANKEGAVGDAQEKKSIRKAALHSGFLEIRPHEVSVLAQVVEWPEEIDIHRAEEAQIRAERRLKQSDSNMARAELSLKRALIRLKVGKGS